MPLPKRSNSLQVFYAFLFMVGLGLLFVVGPAASEGDLTAPSDVIVLRVEGVINPVTAEFIEKGIKKANELGVEALVIELDTPGGLDTSMRIIIKAILGSDVPVAVYVSPSGARAASAGAFITISAHVAAMAPQTNIGAAHPVGVGGDMDEHVAAKASNDAAAYIKSLAERRGRNMEWAEDAVRKSISATETESKEKNIIDFVAENLDDLLEKMDGMEVETVSGTKVLRTKGANVIREEISGRLKLLSFITDPNVAYMLMLLGFYGIFFELTNPGAIFPGVLGGICLVLGFYALQTLPVNYAGLLLIVLGIIMFVLELKIISHGVLTIGGIIAMILGSVMLFESAGPFMKLSFYTILPSVLVTAAFFLIALNLVIRAHKTKPTTGHEGLIGETGTVSTEITQDSGQVKLHGEIWSAYADEPIGKGEKVAVVEVKGLKVKVIKTS